LMQGSFCFGGGGGGGYLVMLPDVRFRKICSCGGPCTRYKFNAAAMAAVAWRHSSHHNTQHNSNTAHQITPRPCFYRA
jgi:hypothetical protein